jgi:uncharacterized protein
MILYLNTSALVKLYVREQHSDKLRSAVDNTAMVATHVIAYPESRAAFSRAHRMGTIDDAALNKLVQWLDQGWPGFDVVGVDETLARKAGMLAQQLGLRGYDAVHLAAAERLLVGAGVNRIRFAYFDQSLSTAAVELGLNTRL